MYRKLLIAITGFSIIGYASAGDISITAEVANTLKNREVTTAKRDKPSFRAGTFGKAFFGLVGEGLMYSAGNELIAKYNIEDPAIYIGGELSAALSPDCPLAIFRDVEACCAPPPRCLAEAISNGCH